MKINKKTKGNNDQFVIELSRYELREHVARNEISELLHERAYEVASDSFDRPKIPALRDRVNKLAEALGKPELEQIVAKIMEDISTRQRWQSMFFEGSKEQCMAML